MFPFKSFKDHYICQNKPKLRHYSLKVYRTSIIAKHCLKLAEIRKLLYYKVINIPLKSLKLNQQWDKLITKVKEFCPLVV